MNPVPQLNSKNTDMTQFVSVEDLIYTGKISSAPVLKWSDFKNAVADSKNSFVIDDQASSTNCAFRSQTTINCPYGESGDSETGIILRWSRAFQTDDAEDLQLSLDDGGRQIECFSFFYGWNS